jgi:hypothetical protein
MINIYNNWTLDENDSHEDNSVKVKLIGNEYSIIWVNPSELIEKTINMYKNIDSKKDRKIQEAFIRFKLNEPYDPPTISHLNNEIDFQNGVSRSHAAAHLKQELIPALTHYTELNHIKNIIQLYNCPEGYKMRNYINTNVINKLLMLVENI